MADLPSQFSRLKPFKSSSEDEDEGELIVADSVAGGGWSTRKSDKAKSQLSVSHALRSFLVKENVLSEEDAGLETDKQSEALRDLLSRTYFEAPASLLDPSHPLPHYYISSSHNTYLLAHQLYGASSALAYETALNTGSRCVEIDAWDSGDNPDEPKVTHGYTLVSNIPFRAVCETIRDVFDAEVALAEVDPTWSMTPIVLSLENHCSDHGQRRLVQIMQEVFGDRLLSKAVASSSLEGGDNPGGHVTLAELGACIMVIVEYHIPGEIEDESDSNWEDESAAEEEKEAEKVYEDKKKTVASSIIVQELAELGVYAQSVKPSDKSWYDPGQLVNGPHHHLINVSETGLAKHLAANGPAIAKHNSQHLMRVYPKGTRIRSSNLKPMAFWGIGAQICALNWQTFGTSNQLNDALFSGSEGYVLKPAALRGGGDGNLATGRKKRLRLRVAGATEIPLPEGRDADSIKPYATCNLYSACAIEGDTYKRKTSPYKHHKLNLLHRGENPKATDPVWDETLEWVYEDNELVFLRILIKSDDAWARNPMLAAAAVRLLYAGRETKCTILAHFAFEDA